LWQQHHKQSSKTSRDRSEILSNTHHNKHLAFEAFEHHHLIMSEKITVSVMDPQPGHLFVEFHKDGGDGSSTKEKADSGLDVEFKAKHGKHRIYLSKVEHPASSKLHVGDRLLALNGKSVESLGYDLDRIREEFRSNNVVALVVDPTMLK
jgi:PDZ domain